MNKKEEVIKRIEELRAKKDFRDYLWNGVTVIENDGRTIYGGFTVSKKIIFDPLDGLYCYMESYLGRNWSIRTFLSEDLLYTFLANFVPDFLESFKK